MTSVYLTYLLTCVFLVSSIHGHDNKNEDFEAKLEAVLDFPSFLSHSQVKISRSRLASVEDGEKSDTQTPSTSIFIHGNDRTQARIRDQQLLPAFLSEDETVLTSDRFEILNFMNIKFRNVFICVLLNVQLLRLVGRLDALLV